MIKFKTCIYYFDYYVHIINTKEAFDITKDYCKTKKHFFTDVTIVSYMQVFLLRSERFDQKMLNEILNKGCDSVYSHSSYCTIRNTERNCYQNIDMYFECDYKPSLALELLCSNSFKALVNQVFFYFHIIDSKYKNV